MIGGPPVAQTYPYAYPAPVYAAPPAYPQQPPAARPAPAYAAAARPQTRTAPVVRGQMPDEPPARPARLSLDMPSPEALGVKPPPPPLDWADLRVRLDRIGATGFSLDRVPAGGYRFTCRVPAAGGPRLVEGRAATEAEAVRQALEQAAGR